jgi:hypothetical protein
MSVILLQYLVGYVSDWSVFYIYYIVQYMHILLYKTMNEKARFRYRSFVHGLKQVQRPNSWMYLGQKS